MRKPHRALGAATRSHFRRPPLETCVKAEPTIGVTRAIRHRSGRTLCAAATCLPRKLEPSETDYVPTRILSSRLGAGLLPRPPNLWLIEMLAHFLVKVVTIYSLGRDL